MRGLFYRLRVWLYLRQWETDNAGHRIRAKMLWHAYLSVRMLSEIGTRHYAGYGRSR